ncbi:HK97 gp10 family phage protein [uncultured Dubosiella sp.]|uniref:HK97 gp10 family phage protein n=1 Tax=uncultured Dubosiella sp. TaxID=1937011 RepID=UPI0025B380C5|nr:HK97 gp10 family phage protein [uncultured Dubosiella sp.]
MSQCTIDNFSGEVQKILDQMVKDAERASDDTVKAVATKATKIVKENAPVRTGEYKKSIKKKQTEKDHHRSQYTVYADAPHYRRAHFLENGHQTKDGGRVPAHPHFAKGQEYAAQEIVNEFEKNFKK